MTGKQAKEFLGDHWSRWVVEAQEAPLGELRDAKPCWYSTDYYFRDDVLLKNLAQAVEYKIKHPELDFDESETES